MPDEARLNRRISFGDIDIDPDARQALRGGEPLPLGDRGFDVLLALFEHRHRVVSKHELLGRVWSGRVVETNNLSVQVAALRRLLGPDCIATVPGRGYQLTVDLTPPGAETLPAAAPGRPSNNPLIGRAGELAALRAALCAHRLVTLVGTAGIGKTRLARALAEAPGPALPAAVAWVDLAPLQDPDLLLGAVAQACGLLSSAATDATALATALATATASRLMLLVVDNCEHLEAGVAALCRTLLDAAPGLRLMATSQVPLRLESEWLVRLGPLGLPPAAGLQQDRVLQARQARQSGAVALFEARVLAVWPRFELGAANLGAVVDICRQLDGVPLAIELAAARVPLLGVVGLQARLGGSLRLLARPHPDGLPRHETLQAALDWSHALLSAEEQAVFRRLGVFAGSFSLAAAQRLAVDDTLDEWSVLDLLGELIDKSLVVAELDGSAARAAGAPADRVDEPRYRLLETLRQYAAAQLQASGEAEVWRARHAAAFSEHAFAHALTTAQVRSPSDRWPLLLEHDNLRAALDWAAVADPELSLRMAASLLPFWRERGHHAEAQARCERLLAHPANQQPSAARCRVLIVLCAVANERSQTDRLRALANAVLADARALRDPGEEALGHIWLAHAEGADDDMDAAEREYRLALAILRELGDAARIAETLTNIACIAIECGRAAETAPLLDEALVLYRRVDNTWGLGFVSATRSEAALAMNDATTALDWADQGLTHHRRLQHQHRLCFSLIQRAMALRRLERFAEACADLSESLAISIERGFKGHTTAALLQAALVAHDQGEGEGAATLLGAAQRQIRDGGGLGGRHERAEFAQALPRVEQSLPATVWAAAWAAGLALSGADAAARVGPR